MTFAPTLIKTETTGLSKKEWRGYQITDQGVYLTADLFHTQPGTVPDVRVMSVDAFLPGDVLSGLDFTWTTLQTTDGGNGLVTTVRAATTPAGNVVVNTTTTATFNVANTETRTHIVNEDVSVRPSATLSSGDIVTSGNPKRMALSDSVSTTNSVDYDGSTSWQRVKAVDGGGETPAEYMELSFTALAGDELDAVLLLSGINSSGTGLDVQTRITLDGTEVAWQRTSFDASTSQRRNLGLTLQAHELTAGSKTLGAEIFVPDGFNTVQISGGSARARLSYRVFRNA